MQFIVRMKKWLFFWLSIFLFGSISLSLSGVCWLLGWLPRSGRIERGTRCVIYQLMRFWLWYVHWSGMVVLHWEDRDALRSLKGAVLVANHPNLLDICWILSHAPHAICFFKAGIKKNAFLSASSRLAGYISNDSGTAGVREAVERVQQGALLVLFPEGTRTRTPPINPMRPGFALIAKEAGAPIQTLMIESDTQLFTKGHFFTFGSLPMNFRIRMGPRFEPDPRQPARHLAQEVEKAFKRNLSAGCTGSQTSTADPG